MKRLVLFSFELQCIYGFMKYVIQVHVAFAEKYRDCIFRSPKIGS